MAKDESFCGKCGNKISTGDAFCRKCGTSKGEAQKNPIKETKTTKAPKEPNAVEVLLANKKLLLSAVAAIVVIGGLLLLLSQPSTPAKCPASCDDQNPCTSDSCDKSTGYKCANAPLTGAQEGCSSTTGCEQKSCASGTCQTTKSDNCCGNSKCEAGETCISCSADCKCAVGESCTGNTQCTSGNCVSGKCKASGDLCGNSVCDTGENCGTCITDCPCQTGYECKNNQCSKVDTCGNSVCDSAESCSSCPADCGVCKAQIGGTCNVNTDCSSGFCVHKVCRPTSPYCGDAVCDTGETRLGCSSDCGQPLANNFDCFSNGDCKSNYCVHRICRPSSTYCGDDYCDTGETCSSCDDDCCLSNGDECDKDSECESDHCVHDVCRPSEPYCGDGHCDSGETSTSCSKDCGAPAYEADLRYCCYSPFETLCIPLNTGEQDLEMGCNSNEYGSYERYDPDVEVYSDHIRVVVLKPDGTTELADIDVGDSQSFTGGGITTFEISVLDINLA